MYSLDQMLRALRQIAMNYGAKAELAQMSAAISAGNVVNLTQGKGFYWCPTEGHKNFRKDPNPPVMMGPEETLSLAVHKAGGRSFQWFPPNKEAMVYSNDEGGQIYSYTATQDVIDKIVVESNKLPDDGSCYGVILTPENEITMFKC